MTGKNLIGFNLSAEGSSSFQTTNPQSGEFNPTVFLQASSEEVNRAVALAQEIFPVYQNLPLNSRAAFLSSIADEIEVLGDELLELFCLESGLAETRAVVERNRTVFQLRSFSEAILKGDWIDASIDLANEGATPPKPDIRKYMIGLGPIVVFGASNFPLAYSTAGGDTASALAAGCPVIVKSHPMHAGTGELVANAVCRAAKKTGMPEGVFSNLNAMNYEVGKQLVLHPAIKAVGFTGSIAGGKALMDLAATRHEPIPVFAEMGSVNPIVFLPGIAESEMERLAILLADSMTQSVGQFCTNPGLLFVPDEKSTVQFLDHLASNYLAKEPGVMLHEEIFSKFENARGLAIESNHQQKIERNGELSINVARQTILVVTAKQFLEQPQLHNEVFGPFSIVVIYPEVIDLYNCLTALEGQLTTSVFGDTEKLTENEVLLSLIQQKAGRIIFNGVPTGVTVCPSMNHGGPYPASSDSRFTAVGIDAMSRFLRPIAFQNCPQLILPEALRDKNTYNIERRVNGKWTSDDLCS